MRASTPRRSRRCPDLAQPSPPHAPAPSLRDPPRAPRAPRPPRPPARAAPLCARRYLTRSLQRVRRYAALAAAPTALQTSARTWPPGCVRASLSDRRCRNGRHAATRPVGLRTQKVGVPASHSTAAQAKQAVARPEARTVHRVDEARAWDGAAATELLPLSAAAPPQRWLPGPQVQPPTPPFHHQLGTATRQPPRAPQWPLAAMSQQQSRRRRRTLARISISRGHCNTPAAAAAAAFLAQHCGTSGSPSRAALSSGMAARRRTTAPLAELYQAGKWGSLCGRTCAEIHCAEPHGQPPCSSRQQTHASAAAASIPASAASIPAAPRHHAHHHAQQWHQHLAPPPPRGGAAGRDRGAANQRPPWYCRRCRPTPKRRRGGAAAVGHLVQRRGERRHRHLRG